MVLMLTAAATLGHAFFWVGLVNRLHALGIRRRTIKRLTLLFFAAAALFLLIAGWWVHNGGGSGGLGAVVWGYIALCASSVPSRCCAWLSSGSYNAGRRHRPALLAASRRDRFARSPAILATEH